MPAGNHNPQGNAATSGYQRLAAQHLASSPFIYTHSSILYVRVSSAYCVREDEHGKLAAAHADACQGTECRRDR